MILYGCTARTLNKYLHMGIIIKTHRNDNEMWYETKLAHCTYIAGVKLLTAPIEKLAIYFPYQYSMLFYCCSHHITPWKWSCVFEYICVIVEPHKHAIMAFWSACFGHDRISKMLSHLYLVNWFDCARLTASNQIMFFLWRFVFRLVQPERCDLWWNTRERS